MDPPGRGLLAGSNILHAYTYSRGQQTLSIKSHIVNILGFAGHMVSVASIQLCHCSMKQVTDNTYINGYGYVPKKKLFMNTEKAENLNPYYFHTSWNFLTFDFYFWPFKSWKILLSPWVIQNPAACQIWPVGHLYHTFKESSLPIYQREVDCLHPSFNYPGVLCLQKEQQTTP